MSLPDREILLKQFEVIILAIEKNSKNVRKDALACLAGIYKCSVRELKEILFD
jgi:vesicle coat complex subunit